MSYFFCFLGLKTYNFDHIFLRRFKPHIYFLSEYAIEIFFKNRFFFKILIQSMSCNMVCVALRLQKHPGPSWWGFQSSRVISSCLLSKYMYAYFTKYKTNQKKPCIMIINQITMDLAAVLELSHLLKYI